LTWRRTACVKLLKVGAYLKLLLSLPLAWHKDKARYFGYIGYTIGDLLPVGPGEGTARPITCFNLRDY
jgi:hypothetical protein